MKNLPKIFINFDTSEIWGRSLISGIVKYAAVYGPWMFYRQPPYYLSKKIHTAVYWAKKFEVDGIIMLEPNPEEEKELIALGIPITVSGYKTELYPSFANLLSDHRGMGRMAAGHLLERGFRFFAFCGYDDFFWSEQRCKGFKEQIEKFGFTVEVYRQPRASSKRSWESEQFVLADWLKSLPKPVGIMTCLDSRSLHIAEACKIAELNIPTDVAVVGVNNDELLCNLSPQPMSSVAISAEQGGYEAAELMDRMLQGKTEMKGQFVLVHPIRVVPRQSTDILVGADREIVESIHYIRNNPKKLVQVEDVAAAAKLSKRTLQRRFRKVVGHSVNDAIKNAQIEYIAQLLRETNMSVSQIAINLGFSGPEHISRLFRRAKGMNASEYRKRFGFGSAHKTI